MREAETVEEVKVERKRVAQMMVKVGKTRVEWLMVETRVQEMMAVGVRAKLVLHRVQRFLLSRYLRIVISITSESNISTSLQFEHLRVYQFLHTYL